MIMRCNINGFCVLAAASSVWLHARRGAEALRASRRRGRLSLVARWRHKVLPAHRRGERGATTWAFSSNFCTEVHGCGMQWPCGRLRISNCVVQSVPSSSRPPCTVALRSRQRRANACTILEDSVITRDHRGMVLRFAPGHSAACRVRRTIRGMIRGDGQRRSYAVIQTE